MIIDRLLIGISSVELTYGALIFGLGHYTLFQFTTLALLIFKATTVAAEYLSRHRLALSRNGAADASADAHDDRHN
jgi:hypothetical protein